MLYRLHLHSDFRLSWCQCFVCACGHWCWLTSLSQRSSSSLGAAFRWTVRDSLSQDGTELLAEVCLSRFRVSIELLLLWHLENLLLEWPYWMASGASRNSSRYGKQEDSHWAKMRWLAPQPFHANTHCLSFWKKLLQWSRLAGAKIWTQFPCKSRRQPRSKAFPKRTLSTSQFESQLRRGSLREWVEQSTWCFRC